MLFLLCSSRVTTGQCREVCKHCFLRSSNVRFFEPEPLFLSVHSFCEYFMYGIIVCRKLKTKKQRISTKN